MLQNLRTNFSPVNGLGVILAGSCSNTTLQQIERHAKTAPLFEINIHDLMAGVNVIPGKIDFALPNTDRAPLISSSASTQQIGTFHKSYGGEALAAALDQLFAELAVQLSLQRAIGVKSNREGATTRTCGNLGVALARRLIC